MNAVPSAERSSLTSIQPGRFCPSSYALGPAAFRAQAEFEADLIYVVGGLYGNTEALQAILACFDAEPVERKLLCFNGDFHWFDRDDDSFAWVEEATRPYLRLRGNVETELASDDDAAGCGCAYPDSVSQDDVDRSNAMLALLKRTARSLGCAEELGGLPPVARVRCGALRVGITHGDDQSLAGWSFAQDRIEQSWREGLAQRMDKIGVQLFASSHTCLPVASSFERDGREYAVINNGAAGMGNFVGDPNGLLTRIAAPAVAEPPIRPLYQTQLSQCHVAALPVVFDGRAWQARFRRMWAVGSEADQSYWQRILNGPSYGLASAVRGRFYI